jgi:hypothetical protein
MYSVVNTHALFSMAKTKEDIEEQPTPRNLSATAARVLQCTCLVAASRKDCSAIVNMIRYMYKTGCSAGERYTGSQWLFSKVLLGALYCCQFIRNKNLSLVSCGHSFLLLSINRAYIQYFINTTCR